MGKHADEPLCPKCGECRRDLVEQREHKTYTEWFCAVCGVSWVVAKPKT